LLQRLRPLRVELGPELTGSTTRPPLPLRQYRTIFFLFIDSDVLKFSRFAIEPRVSSRITLPLFPVPCSRIVLPCRCLCARRAPPSCSLRRPYTHAQRLLLSARTWEPPLFGRSAPRGGRRPSSRPPCSFRRQRTRTQLAVLARVDVYPSTRSQLAVLFTCLPTGLLSRLSTQGVERSNSQAACLLEFELAHFILC
jgi:hypothetical protein